MLRPVVISKGVKRLGRGFSKGELKAVGLSERDAKKLGIAFDKRRKSTREENIKILKDFLSKVRKS